MRSRFSLCLVIIALAAAAAEARQHKHVWLWVTPEAEAFGVLMPEPNFRIRRQLSFDDAFLTPASYEIAHRGVFFSVLSFPKSEPATPKTFDAFVEGFAHALEVNRTRAESLMRPEKDLKLEGRNGRQFAVKVGDAQGTARVYETAKNFYVVMTLGDAADATAAQRFQDSFSFDRGGPTRVPAAVNVVAVDKPAKAPAPLWMVAGATTAIGVRDPAAFGVQPKAGPATGGLVGGGVARKVAPVYPPIAKAARASGEVVVQITVDEEGYVIAAAPRSGHTLLQQAAAQAVRQWRFAPARLEGRPVKVSGTVSVKFALK